MVVQAQGSSHSERKGRQEPAWMQLQKIELLEEIL